MRYTQVDEIRDDAVSVSIMRVDGHTVGEVYGPAKAQDNSLLGTVAGQNGKLKVGEAMKLAHDIARRENCSIVVIDTDGLWKAEWGELQQP